MKKLLISMVAAMSVSLSLCAQESVGTFSLIPKIGVSIANVSGERIYFLSSSGDNEVKGKYNARFAGGLEAEYQALPSTSVSLGAYYVMQGCRYPDFEMGDPKGAASGLSRIRCSMDYLQVPLLVNQYLTDGLAIKAGVQLGFLLKSRFSYKEMPFVHHEDGSREYGVENSFDLDDKDMRRSTDISIPVGISYEYLNVVIDARYHFGLSKLFKDDSLPTERNKVFTITAGYKFNL